MSSSRIVPSSVWGGSRSARWMCTTPRNGPVGVSWGGRVTHTMDASDAGRSVRRTAASICATVASGPRMTGSVVISEPAVDSA